MTDDTKLLQLAAKAAGLQIVGPVEQFIVYPNYEHIGGFIVRNDSGGDSAWNPLGCDGDAFRLAVKLNIWPVLQRYAGGDIISVQHGGAYWESLADETAAPDPYAATRRAIVRAAAAIGGLQDA